MKFIKKILCSVAKRKNTLLGNGFSIENSYDCKWIIDWSNSVDKKMAFNLFEHEQISFLLNSFKNYNPEFFLDIGAHGGLYSIILKKNFPNLKIISFEPDAQNRYQLYGNLFLNNLENKITVFDFGISNINKEVSFGGLKNSNRGGKTIHENGKETILVKQLDKVLSKKNKKFFIKIDVEGHENEVLEGSQKFLKNNNCLIQVEILNDDKLKNFNLLMNKLGYKFINKIDDYYFSNME
tara:strand:+ start:2164 stop:2877 length:714 start_codon:yes stop_codon:yes gene_type:complete